MKACELEEAISENDSLYYWAMSYCKENKCSVKEFIKKNKKDIIVEINRRKKK